MAKYWVEFVTLTVYQTPHDRGDFEEWAISFYVNGKRATNSSALRFLAISQKMATLAWYHWGAFESTSLTTCPISPFQVFMSHVCSFTVIVTGRELDKQEKPWYSSDTDDYLPTAMCTHRRTDCRDVSDEAAMRSIGAQGHTRRYTVDYLLRFQK